MTLPKKQVVNEALCKITHHSDAVDDSLLGFFFFFFPNHADGVV